MTQPYAQRKENETDPKFASRAAYRIHLPGPLRTDLDWSTFTDEALSVDISAKDASINKLKHLYDVFCLSVSAYQQVMDELDEIDNTCWVLEPESPTYSTLYRRISLGNHCSMSFTLDVEQPRRLPMLYSFMGNNEIITPFKEAMKKTSGAWDTSKSVKENFEFVFETKLPSRESAVKRQTELVEDMSLSCAICYTYKSPLGNRPDVYCKHKSCARPFHTECLIEWLRSDSSTKQSYNTLFGLCPYCSEGITCKLII